MTDVLVVEDDADSRAILGSLLSLFNVKTDYAENGTQALTLLQHPDAAYRLALIDLALPGNMDGLELIAWIRTESAFPTMPCIAITAFDFSRLRIQALAAGYTAYHLKPISTTALLNDLKRYLGLG